MKTALLSREEIASRYRLGTSRTALANAAEISRTRVDRILTEYGHDLTPAYVTAETRRNILASYGDGLSAPECARLWHVALATVTNLVYEAGILRPPGRRSGRVQLHPGVDILQLHAQGGARAVSEVASVSLSTAYRMLRDARRTARGMPSASNCDLHNSASCLDCP